MNLTQKLPAVLGLACIMMMTSCSKDEVQTPAPQAEHLNTSSNLKVGGYPSFPSSNGTEGIDILPPYWDRNVAGFPSDPVKYPVGISNRQKLWGNPATPWVQTLPVIPWSPNSNSCITVTSASTWDTKKMSSVMTKLRNLIPGKKYTITVYVGTTVPKIAANSGQSLPTFAKTCKISVKTPFSEQGAIVDLSYAKASWIQKKLTFKAEFPEANFIFSASPEQSGPLCYAHLLVDNFAVTQID